MKKEVTLFILASLIYLSGVFIYAFISYKMGEKEEIKKIDKTLFSVASSANFVLEPLHQNYFSQDKIAPQDYQNACLNLNQLNSYFESKYIYSMILDDKKVRFTSSSYTQKDKLMNRVTKFLDVYKEATPILLDSFKKNSPSFEISSDQWGTFRSILVPAEIEGKGKYIIGCDIEITHINQLLLQKLMTTTFTGLFFLILVIPFCVLYMLNLKKDKNELQTLIDQKTIELAKINDVLTTEHDKMKGLSSKLSKYLPKQLYNSLFTGQMDINVASSRKYLTVFFSDIKDFTSLTYHMEAEEITTILNCYLSEMSKIVGVYGGTIDKYIGDALMVFFGDNDSSSAERDAETCVKMALDMQRKISELQNEKPFSSISGSFEIRIGISSGYCTVGNFGGEDRLDYTIIGNTVNLASRLESNANPSSILISHETYLMVKNKINCIPFEEVKAKGFDKPVKTYHVISLKEEESFTVKFQKKGVNIYLDSQLLLEDDVDAVIDEMEKAISVLKKKLTPNE